MPPMSRIGPGPLAPFLHDNNLLNDYMTNKKQSNPNKDNSDTNNYHSILNGGSSPLLL